MFAIRENATNLDGRQLLPCEREALRLLGVYTAERFDVYLLAGNAKASCRAHVLSAYYGCRKTQREAGITRLRELFQAMAAVKVGDTCLAGREREFMAWARQQAAE